MDNQFLRALNKAGVQATPENVEVIREYIRRLFAQLTEADTDVAAELRPMWEQACALLSQMEAMTPESARGASPPSPSWDKAAERWLSEAAVGSLHDAKQRPHRRDGKIKPRPRWSEDKVPSTSDAWDFGDLEGAIKAIIAQNPEAWPKMKPRKPRNMNKAKDKARSKADFKSLAKRLWEEQQ